MGFVMKLKTLPAAATALAIIAATAGAAFAQTQTGKHEDLLRQTLKASQGGDCPAALMAPTLRGACLQQMPAMGEQLKSRGDIASLEFLGTQTGPSGPVEVYLVSFANKTSMTWIINTAPDGKALVLWSGG